MARAKLTLSIEPAIIERAKEFVERHNTSVSELVSQFLATLEDDESPSTPVAARLRGVLPADVTVEEEYR